MQMTRFFTLTLGFCLVFNMNPMKRIEFLMRTWRFLMNCCVCRFSANRDSLFPVKTARTRPSDLRMAVAKAWQALPTSYKNKWKKLANAAGIDEHESEEEEEEKHEEGEEEMNDECEGEMETREMVNTVLDEVLEKITEKREHEKLNDELEKDTK